MRAVLSLDRRGLFPLHGGLLQLPLLLPLRQAAPPGQREGGAVEQHSGIEIKIKYLGDSV